MNDIFDMMDENKKVSYDKAYIEELYLKYMATGTVQEERKNELKETISGKKILLVAPGKSSVDEIEKIKSFIDDNTVVFSVNFAHDVFVSDFIFLSNLRRFRELNEEYKSKCIVTSNIPASGVFLQTNYKNLVNNEESVCDNAGLMAIKFLMDYDVEGIYLAGFDGYSHETKENYGSRELAFITKNSVLDAMNVGMENVLKKYVEQVKIVFLTTPKFVKI